jgi:tetratricopeptide (TPR) repeat protein
MRRRLRSNSPFVAAALLAVQIAIAAQPRVPDAAGVASIRQLIQTGRTAEAQTRLKEFDPAQPLVAYLRGLALYHADDHAKAIDTLLPVVPELAAGTLERREAEQVLGLALYAAGRLREALPYLEATRAWARDNVELHYYLALAYLQTGKIDAARDALAVTFAVPPDQAGVHLIAAQQLIRLNLDETAAAELKRALEKDARLPNARYLLGQMALFRGRLEESAEWTRGESRQCNGVVPAGRRLYPRGEVGSGHRDAAALPVGEPVLQRPVHSARPRL